MTVVTEARGEQVRPGLTPRAPDRNRRAHPPRERGRAAGLGPGRAAGLGLGRAAGLGPGRAAGLGPGRAPALREEWYVRRLATLVRIVWPFNALIFIALVMATPIVLVFPIASTIVTGPKRVNNNVMLRILKELQFCIHSRIAVE
jgi:hypothetical protein